METCLSVTISTSTGDNFTHNLQERTWSHHAPGRPSGRLAVALGTGSWESFQHSLAEKSGTPGFTLCRHHDSQAAPGNLEGPGVLATCQAEGTMCLVSSRILHFWAEGHLLPRCSTLNTTLHSHLFGGARVMLCGFTG